MLSLPKGGGAIRGIDETFKTNPATGTASLSIPLPASPGRSGFGPALALGYDSGGGNGTFGHGWAVGIESVRRLTDRGMPRYRDEEHSDAFVLGGELVPYLDDSSGTWEPVTRPDKIGSDHYTVDRFRHRVEVGCPRVERWRNQHTNEVHWRVTDHANIESRYGVTDTARIADPADPTRVFEWLLEERRDPYGNVLKLEYAPEDGAGVDFNTPFERGRADAGFAQRYIKRALYCNDQPGVAGSFRMQLVFDYGEHDADAPTPDPDPALTWLPRPDPFSTNRPGFEVRTYRLARRVLMFHEFDELGPEPCLIQSLDLTYDSSNTLTKLISVSSTGYIRQNGAYSKASRPPIEFDYSPVEVSADVEELDAASLGALPIDMHGRPRWLDLDGEGIAGAFGQADDAWFYKRNLGGGRLGPLEIVVTAPAPAAGSGTRLVDVDGDGRLELLRLDSGGDAGFYGRAEDDSWQPFRSFASLPDVSLDDPEVRLLDLNGDGLADAVRLDESGGVQWYRSAGRQGYDETASEGPPLDQRGPPAFVFADATQTTFVADMSGDGLMDIVRVRNGEVSYHPNLGWGRFGARVVMDGAPVFDAYCDFDPARVRLADVDGSGPTDLLYLDDKQVSVWFNESGNSWSAEADIAQLPAVDEVSDIEVADLAGRGTACLVWSSALPGEAQRSVRFLDMMSAGKPHLMVRVRNNLGLERTIAYQSSTEQYLAARVAGEPWRTRTPFPMHVVAAVETREYLSATSTHSTFTYRDPYYDGAERASRGFARIDQVDSDRFSVFADPQAPAPEFVSPPALSRTWSHTGCFGLPASRGWADEYYAGDPHKPALPDSVLPDGLDGAGLRDALRALHGQTLRTELYGQDGSALEDEPYRAAEKNYTVVQLQPATATAPAAFRVDPRESLELTYERDPTDPRIAHSFTLEVDEFGTPTRTAAAAYPRRANALGVQAKTLATVAESDVINLPAATGAYRIGLPAENRSYEVTGLAPAPGSLLELDDLTEAATAPEIDFEDAPSPGTLQRRLISRSRSTYSADDLSGELALGQAGALALPYLQRTAVFTPGLVTLAFGTRVTNAMLTGEGGFVQANGFWWAPSARQEFDPARFYLPITDIDQFGNATSVGYDDYALLMTDVTDALNNKSSAVNHYRTLHPWLVTDANGNRSAARFNELGLVVASAVMGKVGANEGDVLDLTSTESAAGDDATSYVNFALFRWMNSGLPVAIYTRARETHGDPNTAWHESYSYQDGAQRELMTKQPAAPGLAPKRDAQGRLVLGVNGEPVLAQASPRWIGTGRVVHDDKGRVVKQYEPYFSSTFEWESETELVERGVGPVTTYDPVGRDVRVDRPDGTFSKTVPAAWKSETWDENDGVLDSDWYATRKTLPQSDPQGRAARLAASCAKTPGIAHVDPMGHSFRTDAIKGFDAAGAPVVLSTLIDVDIKGNTVAITDPRGNTATTRRLSMDGRTLYEETASGGGRWTLMDCAGGALRGWDANGFAHLTVSDVLRRPTHQYATPPGGAELLVVRTLFGESAASPSDHNVRGRAVAVYDSAGLSSTDRCDFKSNVLDASRRFATFAVAPQQTVDWSAVAGKNTPAAAASAAAAQLEDETIASQSSYDGLNRIASEQQSSVTANGTQPLRTVTISYDGGSLPISLSVALRGGATEAYVTGATYDEHGRRAQIDYGSGVSTTYTYDPLSFRLVAQRSATAAGDVLQDMTYVYDPVGNILAIDDAAQPTVFYDSGVVGAGRRYEYDPLYQLVAGEGREHIAQGPNPLYDPDDASRRGLPSPADRQALRRYGETYAYDDAGNIAEIVHRLTSATGQVLWRRRHDIAATSDRLMSTSMPGDGPGALPPRYSYDAHGNTTTMPHLTQLDWDYSDHLAHAARGGGTDAYYAYDSSGTRVRQVLVKNGGTIVEERIYAGAFERYTKTVNGAVTLVRETVHVLDVGSRVAIVETDVTPGAAGQPVRRYQLTDSLASVAIELDDQANPISVEEYSPFGSTSYQAGPNSDLVSLKRYRYTGKERDDVTGFGYHSARYYAPWLGRWTSCDPLGLQAGTNAYRYASNNPTSRHDPAGTQETNVVAQFGSLDEALHGLTQFADQSAATVDAAEHMVTEWQETFYLTRGTLESGGELQIGGQFILDADRLAHSHVNVGSPPTGLARAAGDIQTLAAREVQRGVLEHATYSSANGYQADPSRTLLRFNEAGDAGEYLTFRPNGSVQLTRFEQRAGQWVAEGQSGRQLGALRGALARIRASQGSALARFAAQEGQNAGGAAALARFGRGALRVGGTVLRYGGGFLAAAGSFASGYQIGTGVDELTNGKKALGSVDVAEGGAHLGLALVTTSSVVAAANGTAATGALALGGGGLAVAGAGLAAAGGVILAADSLRSAIKGEKSIVEKLDEKAGVGVTDAYGTLQKSKYVPQIVKDVYKAQYEGAADLYYKLFLK